MSLHLLLRRTGLAGRRFSTMAEAAKRKALSIGTHSGSFHADEALGCFLLSSLDRYKDATIIRTRDPAVLKDLDIIIDVGGVYDPSINRFDHHQRGFEEVFGHGHHTKLSSAGLVYKHFGREIIAKHLKLPSDDPNVETIWLQVYKNFVEAMDAIDNGVNQYDTDKAPRYVNYTGLSARVGKLNPSWNQPFTDEGLDAGFRKAMQLTGAEFLDAVDYVAQVWLPARDIVKEAIEGRHQVDPSGQIIVLKKVAPWKEHLYDLEEELGVSPPILYTLYEDEREKKWRIQCVSASPGSFENRRSMPAAWCGLRDAALSEVCGIPGCVFVHANGFIGGNDTYEGVLAMARNSIGASS